MAATGDRHFDVIVLGTGTAGATVAQACRAERRSVAIVDERPFGGTCQLRGCDPKKVLVQGAELVDHSVRMQARGAGGSLRGDWPALMRFKRSFTDPAPARAEKSFADAGIEAFHGHARFVGPASVAIGDEVLSAEYVVIATGARPAELAFDGAEHVVTSDAFLELDRLPSPIVFVGGGYVSFELAHLAARFGAAVRIVHRGALPLEHFDPDLVEQLLAAGAERGIQVELRADIERVERTDQRFVVHATRGRRFDAALVVHGAGRTPNVGGLDLDRAGVARAKGGGVAVDGYLRSTTNPQVYAAGDAAGAGHPALTPVASAHGKVVADNILHGNQRTIDLADVPSVVFTIPALAAVGLLERDAKAKGIPYRAHVKDASGWYSTRSLGDAHAGAKVLVEEATGLILGAHLFGPHAAEVINVFALAIGARMTADALRATTFAYPTGASDVGYMV